MTDKKIDLIRPDVDFLQQGDNVVRKHTQNITQSFMDGLAEQRKASTSTREGDFMRVASIPTVVIEKWMREGFNVLTDKNITGRDIVKRLKAEGLDGFLTTEKRL